MNLATEKVQLSVVLLVEPLGQLLTQITNHNIATHIRKLTILKANHDITTPVRTSAHPDKQKRDAAEQPVAGAVLMTNIRVKRNHLAFNDVARSPYAMAMLLAQMLPGKPSEY